MLWIVFLGSNLHILITDTIKTILLNLEAALKSFFVTLFILFTAAAHADSFGHKELMLENLALQQIGLVESLKVFKPPFNTEAKFCFSYSNNSRFGMEAFQTLIYDKTLEEMLPALFNEYHKEVISDLGGEESYQKILVLTSEALEIEKSLVCSYSRSTEFRAQLIKLFGKMITINIFIDKESNTSEAALKVAKDSGYISDEEYSVLMKGI